MSTEYYGEAYKVEIFIGGPVEQIEQACREFVLLGLCVTVTPTNYIFTHGEQSGVIIGLINYPKYPSKPEELWNTAKELAEFLLERTHQGSYTIADMSSVYTFDRRNQS